MNLDSIKSDCRFSGITESADEVIKSLCLREGDVLGKNYWKYRGAVREVFLDLNLYAIRDTKRYILSVDKTTGTVEMPDKALKISNVAVMDCGRMLYLSHTDKLVQGIIDLSVADTCGCECGCNGTVCHNIKSYEPLIEMVEMDMPDNTKKTFQAVTRKRVDGDGSLLVERTFPVRKMTNGVWTGVELTTEVDRICNVDVAPCGCVKETPENIAKLNDCCCAKTLAEECGCLNPIPDLHYGITDEGDRLIMPPGFCYDKIIVRVYHTPDKIKDLRIPLIAKPTFMWGIKNATAIHDDEIPLSKVDRFELRFRKAKDKLFDDMNKWSLKGLYEVLTPKINML